MELSRLSLSHPPIAPPPFSHHLPALPTFFTNRRRRRAFCSASNSDTLLAASAAAKKHKEDDGDLKAWMHKHGLPPCKVVLKEKPSLHDSLKPIHYVAASEDLQVCLIHVILFLIYLFILLLLRNVSCWIECNHSGKYFFSLIFRYFCCKMFECVNESQPFICMTFKVVNIEIKGLMTMHSPCNNFYTDSQSQTDD